MGTSLWKEIYEKSWKASAKTPNYQEESWVLLFNLQWQKFQYMLTTMTAPIII